jgi:hypothetical protein
MWTLLLILLAFALGSSAAASQEPERRGGFWLNAGLGYGSLSCLDCNIREGALSGGLALGGSLSQKLQLGGALNQCWKSVPGGNVTVGTIAAVVRFYPSATAGFFLMGGPGLGTIHRSAPGFGSDTQTGFGAIAGLGFDIRVAEHFSVTPFANAFAVVLDDTDANVGQIGLGVTVQ